MNTKYYVAYGSNLNFEQMKKRCPTAEYCGSGTLQDYALQFKGQNGGYFLTVSPERDQQTPVGIWKITARDEKALDFYEGYPSHYFKQQVPIDMDGQKITGMIYVMNPEMQFGLPSAYYYQVCRDGYKNCGLDVSALNKALQESVTQYYENSFQSNLQMCFSDDEELDYEEGMHL